MRKQNFFHRIGNFISKKKTVDFETLSTGSYQFSNGLEDFFDALNLRTFRESLYLFIGVSMIRETVSSIPLEMYQILNIDGDSQEIYDDPFLDVLSRPNNTQTQKEFWKLAIAHYLLAGEAFWYMERTDEKAIPTAIVNMRPDAVQIVFAADKVTIVGYNFNQINGQVIHLLPFEVLHIKNIDPINPGRGIGVIRPATSRIITEKEASRHQSMTFRNQGKPDVAVFTEQDLTDEMIEEAQRRWQKKFGSDKGSQVALFGNGTKSMQMLNTSPKDMDFIPSMNFLRDDILAVMHIPKAMITSDDVNLANAQVARIIYVKEACMPILDVFLDVINNKLLVDMDNDRFLSYDCPVNEDRETLLKESTQLKQAGIITIDEARDLMNYAPIEGGDMLAPGSMQQNPAQQTLSFKMKKSRIQKNARNVLRKRKVLIKKFKAIDATIELMKAEKAVTRQRNSVFNTPELKDAYIKAFNDNIDVKSEIFKSNIEIYNKEFYKRIMDHMEKFGLNQQHFFDVATEIQEARKIFTPLMKNMFSRFGQEALDNVAAGFALNKASEQFHSPEALLEALNARSEFFTQSMLNTDYNELTQIISDGIIEGKGIDAIGRDIRGYFDNMSVARAKTIARTETGRIVSQATNEAYRQSAVVTGKEWLTAGDDRVRDEHVLNAGVIVDTGGAFPDGEHYPGESSINCRCALAPAV